MSSDRLQIRARARADRSWLRLLSALGVPGPPHRGRGRAASDGRHPGRGQRKAPACRWREGADGLPPCADCGARPALTGDGLGAVTRSVERTDSGIAEWLEQRAEPDWFRHYATRVEDSCFSKARAKREVTGRRIGADGMRLLQAVTSPDVPCQLRALPKVETLRQIWVLHSHLVDGERSEGAQKGSPPGTQRLVTPYDTDTCTGSKRDLDWDGYKVHLTETWP